MYILNNCRLTERNKQANDQLKIMLEQRDRDLAAQLNQFLQEIPDDDNEGPLLLL